MSLGQHPIAKAESNSLHIIGINLSLLGDLDIIEAIYFFALIHDRNCREH